MIKRVFTYTFVVFLITACDSDSTWDCIKSTGALIQEEIPLETFEKLDVRHRIQLIVKEGEQQEVVLETGENLRDDITFSVVDGVLQIENQTSCNLFREYGITKVYVTSPNITQIRNGSGLAVLSDGVLTYPSLALVSENTNIEDDIHTVGDFNLQLEVQNFTIIANGKSNFFLSGQAETASIGLYSGDGRVEAANFVVQELDIYHRSSNKMIVNPRQSILGEIRSVGDVVSVFHPPVVEVEEYYTGQLIFQ